MSRLRHYLQKDDRTKASKNARMPSRHERVDVRSMPKHLSSHSGVQSVVIWSSDSPSSSSGDGLTAVDTPTLVPRLGKSDSGADIQTTTTKSLFQCGDEPLLDEFFKQGIASLCAVDGDNQFELSDEKFCQKMTQLRTNVQKRLDREM